MAMKPIGSFVGDGTPPRAGGKETSYGPLRAILNPEAVQNVGRREASYRTAGRLGEEIRSSEVSFRDRGVVE